MYDEDLDALAAEYVLGTLSGEERGHAEALLMIDPGFVELVRQWERRLGELNVMVEAVEPPPELWTKIKSEIDTVTPADEARLAPLQPIIPESEAKPEPKIDLRPEIKGEAKKSEIRSDAKSEPKSENQKSALLAALASTLLDQENDGAGKSSADSTIRPTLPLGAGKTERNNDVFYLSHRLRRWRMIAIAAGAMAVLLAAFVAFSQIAPGIIPVGGLHVPQLVSQTPGTGTATGSTNRFVAVLQQDPTLPAFLLTIDPAARTLTVRRNAGAPDADHTFALWIVPSRGAKPRALGIVGTGEFTQSALPSDLDPAAMSAATFQVTFERAGAQGTAPAGPVLFTGRLVEAVPVAQPAAK